MDLDLNPCTQLNHAIVGQSKETRHTPGVARHEGKQGFPPMCHTCTSGGHHNFATQEIGGLEQVDWQAFRFAQFQRLWDVRCVHEAVIDLHLPESRHKRLHFNSLIKWYPRHTVEHYGENQIALVQYLVVFEVVHQGLRHGARVGYCVHGRSWHAVHVVRRQCGDKGQQLRDIMTNAFNQQFAATPPRCHDDEYADAQHQGEPTPLEELE